ncbi:MAG: hypothetical protein R2882_06745 [Gemmatimonadales bacterium]
MLRRVVATAALLAGFAAGAEAQIRAPGNVWPVTSPEASGSIVTVLDSIAAEIARGTTDTSTGCW